MIAATILSMLGLIAQQGPVAPEWSFEQTCRIGSINNPDEALTSVSQVVIGADTRLYVAQPEDLTIRVYSANGRLVGTVGRSGHGPGEFQSLNAIGFLADTLYASDNALLRVNFFTPDGRPRTSFTWASPPFEIVPVQYIPTPPDVLLRDGSGLVKPRAGVARGSGRNARPQRVILHIDRRGHVLDTVTWQNIRPADPLYRAVVISGRAVAINPFDQEPIYLIAPDGSGVVVVERSVAVRADKGEFSVRKIATNPGQSFFRTYSYTPVAVTRSVVDHAIDDIMAQFATRPANRGGGPQGPKPKGTSEVAGALVSGGHIPRFQPPVSQAAATQDGSIWLKREETSDGRFAAWNVLDKGVIRATVRLAPSEMVMAFRNDVLITSEVDSLGVPYVLCRRLRK